MSWLTRLLDFVERRMREEEVQQEGHQVMTTGQNRDGEQQLETGLGSRQGSGRIHKHEDDGVTAELVEGAPVSEY